jgi:RHS repeat-associated protein
MMQRSTTAYDKVGNMKQSTDFNGETIRYDYNELNELIAKHFLAEGRSTTFSYTSSGKRDLVTDDRGITDYDYDVMGRLTNQTDPDGKVIAYSYDLTTGKVATIATPSGTTTHKYNSLGQLEQVIAANGQTSYVYDAVGNLKQVMLPNQVTQTYQYDKLNRLEVLETKDKNGNLLSKYSYSYDKAGNRKTVEELQGTATRHLEYSYDALNRLVGESLTDAVNGDRLTEYAYDNVGNRASKRETIAGQTTETLYTYDNNDRLLNEITAGTATIYTYDNNGNLITKQTTGQQTTYNWDQENRLMGAAIATAIGTQQLGYKYDVDGVRVAAIVGGQETRYLVDTNRQYAEVIEEYSFAGQAQTSYVYGLDLISQTRSGTDSFYLHDGFGSVRSLSNAAGAVTDTYSYDAYGNLMRSSGVTENDYGYRGEQFDFNLGMQYLRARYYDSSTGRFASTDPFEGRQEQPVSRHRYIYGNDNPVVYSDPSGLISMSDVAITMYLLGITASSTQAVLGLAIGGLTGFTQWDGYYAQVSPTLEPASLSGSVILAAAATEPVNGHQTKRLFSTQLDCTRLRLDVLRSRQR